MSVAITFSLVGIIFRHIGMSLCLKSVSSCDPVTIISLYIDYMYFLWLKKSANFENISLEVAHPHKAWVNCASGGWLFSKKKFIGI